MSKQFQIKSLGGVLIIGVQLVNLVNKRKPNLGHLHFSLSKMNTDGLKFWDANNEGHKNQGPDKERIWVTPLNWVKDNCLRNGKMDYSSIPWISAPSPSSVKPSQWLI